MTNLLQPYLHNWNNVFVIVMPEIAKEGTQKVNELITRWRKGYILGIFLGTQ